MVLLHRLRQPSVLSTAAFRREIDLIAVRAISVLVAGFVWGMAVAHGQPVGPRPSGPSEAPRPFYDESQFWIAEPSARSPAELARQRQQELKREQQRRAQEKAKFELTLKETAELGDAFKSELQARLQSTTAADVEQLGQRMERSKDDGAVKAALLLHALERHPEIDIKGQPVWKKAGPQLLSQAKRGNALAMKSSCQLLSEGEAGLKQDIPQAIQWCETAAKAGMGSAYTMLGAMHESG